MLVALGRATVVTNPNTYNNNDLDEFVKLVREVKLSEKMKVADGGLFINQVVISKKLANPNDVKDIVDSAGRGYYNRDKETNQIRGHNEAS
ncbi:MAG: hypothetical protein ACKPKO_34855, partial [Candidatus Fonsibacter sp.]